MNIRDNTIGFMCDIRENASHLMRIVGSSRQHRAIAMDQACSELGCKLFIFSKKQVNTNNKHAFGYVLSNNSFIPSIRPIPKVCGNWFFGISKENKFNHLRTREFYQWATENNICLYPGIDFLELTLDKHSTYQQVKACEFIRQSETQLLKQVQEQLCYFFSKNSSIFIKPRRGSQGQGVIKIQKHQTSFITSSYKNEQKETRVSKDVQTCTDLIQELTENKDYIIQSGIETKKYQDKPFIIRVIMINDSEQWHFTSKCVLAGQYSDIANTTQGSTNYETTHFLSLIYNKESLAMLSTIESTSIALVQYLNECFHDKIMELAIDFTIDDNDQLYFLEMDVQPGVVRPGMDPNTPFKDIFNLSESERVIYDNFVKPHGEYLASFLINKLQTKLR